AASSSLMRILRHEVNLLDIVSSLSFRPCAARASPRGALQLRDPPRGPRAAPGPSPHPMETRKTSFTHNVEQWDLTARTDRALPEGSKTYLFSLDAAGRFHAFERRVRNAHRSAAAPRPAEVCSTGARKIFRAEETTLPHAENFRHRRPARLARRLLFREGHRV